MVSIEWSRREDGGDSKEFEFEFVFDPVVEVAFQFAGGKKCNGFCYALRFALIFDGDFSCVIVIRVDDHVEKRSL